MPVTSSSFFFTGSFFSFFFFPFFPFPSSFFRPRHLLPLRSDWLMALRLLGSLIHPINTCPLSSWFHLAFCCCCVWSTRSIHNCLIDDFFSTQYVYSKIYFTTMCCHQGKFDIWMLYFHAINRWILNFFPGDQ